MTTTRPATGIRRWNPLIERFQSREALVGVVGLGYVGLPVALTFAEAGFRVAGVDLDAERVHSLRKGSSYLHDIPDERLQELLKTKRFKAQSSYKGLDAADAILICLPTPLTDGLPDLSYIVDAGKALVEHLDNALIVLESTTYPGTTEELLQPLLEAQGLVAGKDFLLAYSPERIDPGNAFYSFGDVPKVVGGVNTSSRAAAQALYEQVIPKVVTVSGTREAELAKLIENTFRHVNIALVNELAVYAHEMDIDIWEAIGAAATKPFGFLPFWPGPGWGGHCIPLDPAYLSYRVRRTRAHEVRFVELAHAVNSEMTRHVVERATRMLNDRGKVPKGARVLGVGAAYKGGTEDVRESPGVKVLTALDARGVKVTYHDPLVESLQIGKRNLRSSALTPDFLHKQDLVIVLVAQEGVDHHVIGAEAPLVFDCCNALGKRNGKVVRL